MANEALVPSGIHLNHIAGQTSPGRAVTGDEDVSSHDVPAATDRKAADSECVLVDEPDSIHPGDFKCKQKFGGRVLLWLAYQSTGVIYGDIGTSPLYVYSSTFAKEPSYDDLLGALSLIIWSITLIVTIKYVLIVLCADDEGEGGTFAIYSLLSRYCCIAKRDPKEDKIVKMERYLDTNMRPANRGVRNFLEQNMTAHFLLKALAVFGVALILADSILTPAQSVLGAIQGLKVIKADMETGTIVGISCAIIVSLFSLQPLGIFKIGSVFAPIVVTWLLFNASFGIYNLVKHDHSVLKAFSPYFAGSYFVRNKKDGWLSLGGILLCFTGVEALFADLGAFSRRAIQISWLGFTYPCLLLTYVGQAAYISREPSAYANPFFNTVPPRMFYPSLIISILAAIVASQAMITSTFQLLSQVMHMSYFPQLKTVHTSDRFHGQVYIPFANWLIMVGTLIVTAVYNNTTRLGHAYGVCVILVTFITTCLVTLVAIIVWRLPLLLVLAVWLPFITLDGLYLSSAVTKLPDGAWFTLLLAVILSTVFILWRYGKERQWKAESTDLIKELTGLVTVSKTSTGGIETFLNGREGESLGIFFDKGGDAVPALYEEFLRKFEAHPSVRVFLHFRALSKPRVPAEEKYSVRRTVLPDTYRLVIRHGYNDRVITADLGEVVYAEVRKALFRVSHADRSFLSDPLADPDRMPAASSARCRTATPNARAGPGEGGEEEAMRPSGTASHPHVSNESPMTGASAPSPNSNWPSAPSTSLSQAVAALDRSYAQGTVYIAGHPQLRVHQAPPSVLRDGGSSSRKRYARPLDRWRRATADLVRPGKVLEAAALGIFVWLRENTRARIAQWDVPAEKLVEVGFVRDI